MQFIESMSESWYFAQNFITGDHNDDFYIAFTPDGNQGSIKLIKISSVLTFPTIDWAFKYFDDGTISAKASTLVSMMRECKNDYIII